MPLQTKIQLIQSAIKALADCAKLLGSTYIIFATFGAFLKSGLAYLVLYFTH